jgi:hypothetical protein
MSVLPLGGRVQLKKKGAIADGGPPLGKLQPDCTCPAQAKAPAGCSSGTYGRVGDKTMVDTGAFTNLAGIMHDTEKKPGPAPAAELRMSSIRPTTRNC